MSGVVGAETLDSGAGPAQARSGRRRETLVYEAILRAYVTGQVAAGTRLPEQHLAEIFGVSRERVRKVLHRLAHERWLEIRPNRGARVPRPGMEDAREVVQARIVMETGILEQLLEQPRLIDGATLRRHLAEEQKGEREGDAIEVMRLTARFHSIIAGFLRNQWISRHLEQLVLRSLVFVSLYGEAIGPSFCGPAEHRQIARHLLDGDGARASAAMVAHLKAMELFLDFRTERRPARPLAEVFAGPEPKGQ